MFSSVRAFISRHRRKFIAGGLIAGGVILLSKYARIKIEEWQERKTKEFIDRTRKNQHFESTERTCNQTILSLYKSLSDEICKQFSTDELVERLKNKSENRIEIWNEIKVISFSRVTAIVYCTVMLVAILRVQLNIIGGYLFKNTGNISSDFQEKYLSLCQRYLNEGLTEINKNILQKVRLALTKFDLKQKMSLQDVELLFWSIQSQLSSDLNDPILRIADFLITEESKSDESELYRKVLNETCDLLESDEVRNVCSSNVSRSFSCLIDSISEYYNTGGAGSADEEFINPNKSQMPMAKLIPIVNGILSPNLSDGANIYEAFCEE